MNFSKILRKLKNYSGGLLGYIRIMYLRMVGVSIGKKCFISFGAKIDTRRGQLIIGDKCEITHGCVILSHDASAKRINRNDNGSGKVKIGNNVFIGVNSVILRNVTIGDNSIIGAGSIVTKDVPPNVVVVGNPAKVIRKLPEKK